MSLTTRKFTFLKLEFRSFILTDYLYLTGFTILVLLSRFPHFFGLNNSFSYSGTINISLILSFLTAGPFGLRFRNVFFSIIWLILCLLFVVDGYYVTFVPLVLFFMYHIVRRCFWYYHKKELIPFHIAKGALFRHRSYFEQRSGTAIDKRYTKIIGVLSFLIFFIFFLLDTVNP